MGENKKIVLSAIGALKEKSIDEIKEYISKHKLERVSAEDIRNASADSVDSSGFPNYEAPEETIVPNPPAS